MDVQTLAEDLRGLMRQEGDLAFRYAEVAREAPDDNELRIAGELAGWFETREWATLRMYRLIGLAYKEGGWVPDRSWTAHAEAYAHPDRYAILAQHSTKRAIRAATGKKPMQDDANAQSAVLVDKLSLGSFDADDPSVQEAILRAAAKVQETQRQGVELTDRFAGREPDSFVQATGIAHGLLTGLKRAGRLVTDEWQAHEKQEYLESLTDIEHEIKAQRMRLDLTPESIIGGSA